MNKLRTQHYQIHRRVVDDTTLKIIRELNNDTWIPGIQNLHEAQYFQHTMLKENSVELYQVYHQLTDRLCQLVKHFNDQTYKFDISRGIHEEDGLCILKYSIGHQFGWHVDDGPQGHEAPEPTKFGDGSTCRKLTFSVGLNSSRDYEGGLIEFNNDGNGHTINHSDMFIWPGYMPHRVTPVTKGVRYVLIGYVHGTIWR